MPDINETEAYWLTDYDFNSLLSRIRDENDPFDKTRNEDASHWKKLAAHTAVGAALGAGAAYLEHPKSKGREKAKAALAGGLIGAADAGLHNYIDSRYEGFESVAQTLSEDVPPPDRGEFQRAVEGRLKS